ncbi:hypothetical protein FHU36_003825 [Nonomuraea muscovyensis]|uniref:Uncharacterized protein n=1 Tax=Nonomuraea muscovyensis TaxID=1124761 RepID=A0A7X0C4G1_9ACTN|nr:hypothetical protein [Nonomuraea muscovyensis]
MSAVALPGTPLVAMIRTGASPENGVHGTTPSATAAVA